MSLFTFTYSSVRNNYQNMETFKIYLSNFVISPGGTNLFYRLVDTYQAKSDSVSRVSWNTSYPFFS